MNFLQLLRGHSPFSKTSSSPLLAPLLLAKPNSRAGLGDPQRFQIPPFAASLRATSNTVHVHLGFANNFATKSSCLDIIDVNFQILLWLIKYVPMVLGGKYMYRKKLLPATVITTISTNCQTEYDKKPSFIKRGW